jgi:hypothetical protein
MQVLKLIDSRIAASTALVVSFALLIAVVILG